ncbi:helix-turn-helix domain-containing protein [Bradyrhizobium sp. HKCCYLR20261]|uniref:helix-turn-helix domain-containing protein n=1 Tax=Bradyrhizobium sp. HKCCYLR20261 TaxID=3420760 RepID=UPI003EBAC229
MAKRQNVADRRGRSIALPPSRIGRLLVALRESVGKRSLNPHAHPEFRKRVHTLKRLGLSRIEASDWIQAIHGHQISPDQLRRIETGTGHRPSQEALRAILTAYGLSAEEVNAVVEDPNLTSMLGANPHLMAAWRMRNLALGEFGPTITEALRVDDFVSTWIEMEKAASGGFRDGEIVVIVDHSIVEPPEDFEKLAKAAADQNAQKIAEGIRGWTDNPTFCLLSVNEPQDGDQLDYAIRSITSEIGADAEERPQITLRLQHSWYRYNVIAKQAAGAAHRWRALQEATIPLKPEPYLASGIGVCINVICDGGRSIVIGQRSFDETFRKGELDIAVVEGIRPSAEGAGSTTITDAAYRALSEELGVNKKILKRSIDEIVKRLVIFEFGCDLEYYQFNFLAFAEVDLDFETLFHAWQKAKDRKENQTLHRIAFDEAEVRDFATKNPIWSSGIACALRTFDYY